jgi:hypothetical protein
MNSEEFQYLPSKYMVLKSITPTNGGTAAKKTTHCIFEKKI